MFKECNLEAATVLTATEKDNLESLAMLAFKGRPLPLAGDAGFQIIGEKGPVAAIFWRDVAVGNDIEIALCDNRLTDHLDLETVQRWIEFRRARSELDCVAHPEFPSWSVPGLGPGQATEFLKACKLLRDGFLPPNEIAEARASASRQTPEMAALAKCRAELAGLRPTMRNAVIDLLYRAGLDVSGWYVRKDGGSVAAPRSNPAYCYNWAFEGPREKFVACLWHESLEMLTAA